MAKRYCISLALFLYAPLILAWTLSRWPEQAAASAALTAAGGVALLPGRTAARLIFGVMALLLAGYACMGRSFAYLGIQSLFIGEIVLGLALVGALLSGSIWASFQSRLAWVLLMFTVWGAARTVPYFATYGSDALRDGAIWGYGLFALIVAGTLLRGGLVQDVTRLYGRFAPCFLAWIVIAGAARGLAPGLTAALSPAGGPPLQIKPGDAAVHLGGIAAFLILGLHQRETETRQSVWLKEWLLWGTWLAGLLLFGSQTRGGLLSILAALSTVMLLSRKGRWAKLTVAVLCGLTIFVLADLEIDFGGSRKVSPGQIAMNLTTVTGGGESTTYDGTRRWRLQWWGRIVDYTLFGEYFWQGKGFGINLADDDGFQVSATHSLRSAHNGHLTILARSGVPGFALWLLLQGGLLAGLLRARHRARRNGDDARARLVVWILAYWLALMVNSTFDVYLEGPQGGIWFWSVFGAGLAVIAKKRTASAATAACIERNDSWVTMPC